MSVVRTILGDIAPEQLGVTDAHEHLIRIGGGEVAHGGEDMRLPSVDKAVEETRMFLAAGGKALVDTAPVAWVATSASCWRSTRRLMPTSSRAPASRKGCFTTTRCTGSPGTPSSRSPSC